VSSLLDQVESKVARARRAFIRSRNIIVTARDDLQQHHRWLDHHRVAWAEGVKRDQRLLKRKQVIWTFKRLGLGLILIAPFVCISLFRWTIWILSFPRDLLSISSSRVGVFAYTLGRSLEKRRPQVLWRLSVAATACGWVDTRHHHLQERICGLDGSLWNAKADAQPRVVVVAKRVGETREVPVRSRNSGALRAIARLPSLVEGRGIAWAVGVLIVTLLAAGAVPATILGLTAEAPVPATSKVASAALPATASTAPHKVTRPVLRTVSVPGFRLVEATLVPEPQPLSAHTTASMMLVTSPVAVAPTEPQATKALVAEESPAVKPKMRAKLKPKLAKQDPQQQLPWWERLPWILVR
jgi:hypothetical protein